MRISHIESRLEQQFILKDFIVNAVDNLTKVGDSNISLHRVNARLTALKENWEKFSVIHHAITVAISETSHDEKLQINRHSYFSDNVYSTTYEIYLDAVEKMTALSEHDSTSNNETFISSQISHGPSYFHHTRLPRIDIPKFNGSPSD